MLNTEEQFKVAAKSLTSEDFFKSQHKKIFIAISEAHERNGAVDLPILLTYLKETQPLSDDEYSYLIDLSNMSDRYEKIEFYCQSLQAFSIKRAMVNVHKRASTI